MRCIRCGAEVRSGLSLCPKCGATLRRGRIWARKTRCAACQQRVPAGLSICPSCGAPLRPSWRFLVRGLCALTAVLVLGYLAVRYVPWAAVRALSVQVRMPSLALLATPTLTPSPTGTRTATSTVTLTPTPTVTPVPPTATPTSPPPTATARPAPTRTPEPRFSAPRLLSPDDGAELRGGSAQIRLTWEAAETLADDEWYALSVRFAADGVVQYSGTWTKDTSWIVPGDLYMKAGQAERIFEWDVTMMKQTGTKPGGGRDGEALSSPSETRTFAWY